MKPLPVVLALVGALSGVALAKAPSAAVAKPELLMTARLPQPVFVKHGALPVAVPLTIVIENTSDHPITLFSHVAAGGEHLDASSATLTQPCLKGGRARTLGFTDSRLRSVRVIVTLAPGERMTHVVDLGDWAARHINGRRPLEAGCYRVVVSYAVGGTKGIWNGTLTTAPVDFSIVPMK